MTFAIRLFVSFQVMLTANLCLGHPLRFQQSDGESDETTQSRKEMLAKVKQAVALGPIKIDLKPVNPESSNSVAGQRRLRWSPKGTKVMMTNNGNAMTGQMKIGDFGPFLAEVTLGEKEGVLKIYPGLDRSSSDAQEAKMTVSINRGKKWYSANYEIELPFQDDKDRAYPISVWYVEDPEQPEADPIIRWSRKGWHQGQFQFGDRSCHVLITDANADGQFDARDAFGLGTTQDELFEYKNSAFGIAKHGWLDGVSFRVVDIDKNGEHLTIEAFDLGMTEKEDREANDPYAPDRKYKRSTSSIKFMDNLEQALLKAKNEQKLVLVDFVTTWCGPCKTMDELVYTAQPVVDNSHGFIFVKLDGDNEKELAQRFKVSGYPTLIVLDTDETVVLQRSGYQSVTRMLELLKTKRPDRKSP